MRAFRICLLFCSYYALVGLGIAAIHLASQLWLEEELSLFAFLYIFVLYFAAQVCRILISKQKECLRNADAIEIAKNIESPVANIPFGLFLRSFSWKVELEQILANSLFDIHTYIADKYILLDDLLADSTSVPLISLGKKSGSQDGPGIIRTSENAWKRRFIKIAEGADYILIMPYETEGLAYEVSVILERGWLDRCIFVMPPSHGEEAEEIRKVWETQIVPFWSERFRISFPKYFSVGIMFKLSPLKREVHILTAFPIELYIITYLFKHPYNPMKLWKINECIELLQRTSLTKLRIDWIRIRSQLSTDYTLIKTDRSGGSLFIRKRVLRRIGIMRLADRRSLLSRLDHLCEALGNTNIISDGTDYYHKCQVNAKCALLVGADTGQGVFVVQGIIWNTDRTTDLRRRTKNQLSRLKIEKVSTEFRAWKREANSGFGHYADFFSERLVSRLTGNESILFTLDAFLQYKMNLDFRKTLIVYPAIGAHNYFALNVGREFMNRSCFVEDPKFKLGIVYFREVDLLLIEAVEFKFKPAATIPSSAIPRMISDMIDLACPVHR